MDMHAETEKLMGEVAMEAKRTLWWRLRRKLLPMRWPPYRDHPKGWTALTVTVNVTASWPDRLRLLLTGRAQVNLRVYTDVTVNEAETDSTIHFG